MSYKYGNIKESISNDLKIRSKKAGVEVTKLTINQVLQQGVDAHKTGQLQEAHRLYAAVLKVQPKHPDANHNTGLLTVGFGDIELALPFFKTALEANPSMVQFWYSHIVALIKLERLIDAKALLNQAKSKGITGADFDQLEQKLNDTNKALYIKPNSADVHYNMGTALQNQNKLEEAIEAYNKALAIKPDYVDAYNNLGTVLQLQGKLEEAIEAYKKVLSIKADHVEAYYNMGNALQEQNKLEEAIETYNKALAIKPDYVNAYNNIGNALKDQGKLEKAIDAYNKTLAIKPDYVDTYNNLGTVLQLQGKLEEAIEAYNKALVIWPDYADAIENRLSLLTQVQGTVLARNKEFNQITEDKQLEIIQRPKSHILHAISSFLSADENRAQRHVHNFKTCNPKLLDTLTPTDQLFCFAYSKYLGALLKKPLTGTLNQSTDNVVYHIGESHCLSYAHHTIEINGASFRIVPMIVFGAKAFHFSNTNDSAFKAITKANLDSIPKGSQVFVSFGEIDCRPNEGFISAATKLEQSIEGIVANTLTGYLQWFAKYNRDWNHNMHFVNVPAPEYDQIYDTKKNADVANVVALFNQQMKKRIAQYKFKIIDVFSFTLGKDGFSNSRFHIDAKHLGAKALPKIEQQLNS
ncbi:tetratricopeptide repeat protein [bacterium]|nr:tetratricopeptide repeat protein [bacterium]